LTIQASGRPTPQTQHRSGTSRTRLLIGAAVLLGNTSLSSTVTYAQAAVDLPPVTVEAPKKRTPVRAAASSGARSQAAPVRQRSRTIAVTAAPPTQSERAAAAAVATAEANLHYRAMPSATTLRGAGSPLNTSQSVNLVPAQVIKDQLPRNLDDALVNISGITQTNTLAGTQDAVLRRGFGDNRDGSIMRNGMPVVQGRALNATVESVEVLKGPSSLLYGIMDPGGLVNTISKRPELYQHGSVTLLGSTYANNKSGADGTLDVTGPIGDGGLAYRFIGYGVSEDYWRNFGRHKEMLIAPSVAWYGDTTTVQLNYEHREFITPFDRGTAFYNKAPLAIPSTQRLDEPFNNMWGQSDLIQGSVEQKLNDNWKVTAAYNYNTETYNANQLRISALAPNKSGVLTATRSSDGTWGALSNVSYGTSYVNGSFELGGMKNDLVFGGDAQYRTIYRQYLIRSPSKNAFNVIDPVYGLDTPGTTIGYPDSAQTDKLGTNSLFAQDTLHLTNWLALVGGVRWMQYDQLAGKGLTPFITNTNLSGDKVLPLGGVIFKINDQLSYYVSYTQSLKPTSTIANFVGTGSTFVVDSSIPPEEGTQWETGFKFDLDKRLSGTLAFYDIQKKNVLVADDNGDGTTTPRAASRARSRGVELDVTGKLTDNWSMIGSYAYDDARLIDDPANGNAKLLNAPMNTASLYLVYDFLDALPGRLRLGAGAHYMGDRPGDTVNSFVLSAYTVADVFATYDTKVQNLPVTYQFNVKNLFDKVYYTSTTGSNLNVAIGDARRVSLSATVKF
jgi:iron complex outermembrane receptor protein